MLKAPAKTELDRALALDIVRVTEASAVAAALWRGRGNEAAADEAAAAAMYRELARLPIDGVVVVGEGEEDETPLLYIGETVGAGGDPRSGSISPSIRWKARRLCAKALPNALSVLALADARQSAEGAHHLYGQDRHRSRLSRRPGRSRCLARRQSQGARARQGRADQRDHRLHSRPAAPRQADRGGACMPAPPSASSATAISPG